MCIVQDCNNEPRNNRSDLCQECFNEFLNDKLDYALQVKINSPANDYF